MSYVTMVHECDCCVRVHHGGMRFFLVGKHRRNSNLRTCVLSCTVLLRFSCVSLTVRVPYSVLYHRHPLVLVLVAFFITSGLQVASASLVHKYLSTAQAGVRRETCLRTVQHADRKYPGCSTTVFGQCDFCEIAFGKIPSKKSCFPPQRTMPRRQV